MEYDWGDVSTYSRSIEDLASVYVDFSKIKHILQSNNYLVHRW